MKHIYDISGTFLIPGTREKADFPKTRVVADSRQLASKDLAPMLNEKYSKELPHKHSFSRDFALCHLKWEEVQPKQKAPAPALTPGELSLPSATEVSAEV